jgi:copper oxidase (laccase) domain-containing protein
MDWLTFPALTAPQIRHGFSQRLTVPLENLRYQIELGLTQADYPLEHLIEAEQPHGAGVAALMERQPAQVIPGVDAFATATPHQPLLIRVADCGAVFFFDPVQKVIALAHSGRKGTDLGIVPATITALQKHYGVKPHHLIVQLSPCIRPPHYEVNFAQTIAQQAKAAGVVHFFDCGVCTAANPLQFYSYRAEKGHTGRMYAALMLLSQK